MRFALAAGLKPSRPRIKSIIRKRAGVPLNKISIDRVTCRPSRSEEGLWRSTFPPQTRGQACVEDGGEEKKKRAAVEGESPPAKSKAADLRSCSFFVVALLHAFALPSKTLAAAPTTPCAQLPDRDDEPLFRLIDWCVYVCLSVRVRVAGCKRSLGNGLGCMLDIFSSP